MLPLILVRYDSQASNNQKGINKHILITFFYIKLLSIHIPFYEIANLPWFLGSKKMSTIEIDFEEARQNMIEQQIRTWDVLDQRILDVLATTPREDFVPPKYRNLAFADVEIPLEHGQVMMSPKVEGRLLQALALKTKDQVLEVGTGSGYLTACLSQLSARVLSVDIFSAFHAAAQSKLNTHRRDNNVTLRIGNAAHGWGNQCYDAIAITGSMRHSPNSWQQQLVVGGRLFVIVGQPPVMEALLITRVGAHEWTQESLFDTDIPPLIEEINPSPVFEF
jgi:protein-L-isoaspartate(D-aspartate) O-methyltransferase